MMRNRAVAASCPNFVYIFCLSGVHASLLSIGTPRGGRRARRASRAAPSPRGADHLRGRKHSARISARDRSHSRIHSTANPPSPRRGRGHVQLAHMSQTKLRRAESACGRDKETRTRRPLLRRRHTPDFRGFSADGRARSGGYARARGRSCFDGPLGRAKAKVSPLCAAHAPSLWGRRAPSLLQALSLSDLLIICTISKHNLLIICTNTKARVRITPIVHPLGVHSIS